MRFLGPSDDACRPSIPGLSTVVRKGCPVARGGCRQGLAVGVLAQLALLAFGAGLLPGPQAEGRPSWPEAQGAGSVASGPGSRELTASHRFGGIGPSEPPVAVVAQLNRQQGGEPGSDTSRPSPSQTEGEERIEAGEDRSIRDGHAVPHQRVNLRPNRLVRDEASMLLDVAEELRRSGRLGIYDELEARSEARDLSGKIQRRYRQIHKGVPVFAAEVVVSVSDDRMISIQGHTSPSIDVDTDPANDYERVTSLARMVTGAEIEALDDGLLVILAVAGGHRIGWLGRAVVDGVEERLIFDAKTGQVLFREPLAIGLAQ